MRQDLIKISLLFWMSLGLFTVGLSQQEIIGFDSRFYLFAIEMGRNGLSLFPTTYGQPYPDYPVLSTLLIHGFALLGGLNKFTATLPSAIAAALTVVFTYLIGALRQERLGWYAVLFLFLTVGFFKSARSIALDMYPTLFTTLCFYMIYSADVLNKPARVKWIYLFLVMSFAFRGPIGLIIPQSVISLYYLLNKNVKQFLVTGILAALLLILCTGILLGLAYHEGGYLFLQDVLRMEVLGRLQQAYQPLYFYFSAGIPNYIFSYPLALLVMIGLFFSYKKQDERAFAWQLVGWMLIIILGMSVPAEKKIRYILAATPAFSLLSAYLFVCARGPFFNILRRIFSIFFAILPILLCLSIGCISHIAQTQGLFFPISYAKVALFFIFLLTIHGVLRAIFYKNKLLCEAFILIFAVISSVIFMLMVAEPIDLSLNKTRDVVMKIENERAKNHAALVFFQQNPDGLPIKYMANTPSSLHPLFINNVAELSQINMPVMVVTRKEIFKTLPIAFLEKIKLISDDKMAHVPMVVFYYEK